MTGRSEDREFHKRALKAIVEGAPASTTSEIHAMYDALAPLIYRGTLYEPVRARHYHRALLDELEQRDGEIVAFDFGRPEGRMWLPIDESGDPEGDTETSTREIEAGLS